ncbi:MAG: hypothetical protein Q9202_004773 [Teloschistes flavicans]
MASAQVLVQRALDDLNRTLKPEDARFFRDTTLDELWKEMRAIEHEQGQRLDLRCMRRLEPFLKTMESYSKVIEVFCQGYSPMAFVWGPIKLMLLLARQYGDVMDKVLQAYSDIANVLPRIDKLKSAFGDDADFKQALGLIYSDILEFHQRAYRMFRRKGWHLLFAIHWGLFERRFKSIIQSLALHCDLLDKEAAATHFLEMKAMRDKRKLEEDSYEEQTRNQFSRETLRWLSAEEDSQEEFLHRLSEQRLIGTCDWILDEPEVMTWLEDNDSNPTVWVTGNPGSGKTHACSLIVQHSETKKDRSTLYFFCGSRPVDPKDASTLLLRTLAVQLLRRNLDLAPFIHQIFLQKGLGPSGPTVKKVLKEVLSTVNNVRIILDGLDEWGQTAQQDTLKIIVELQKHGGSQCKLLVSSRKEPSIAKHLPQERHVRITSQSAPGLCCYIQSSVEDLRNQFPDLPPSILGRLQQNLVDKAKETEFDQAIEQLPDGLDEAYGRILTRLTALDPNRRERALKILYWTCTSYRLMSIDEIADGIALKPGQKDLCARNRSQNPDRDILELCAPLLEKSERGTLDMVHFTAKEYLLNSQSGPFIDTSEAYFHIAFSCVVNLTSALVLVPSLGKLTETDIEKAVVAGSYGLHLYAHQYWADHVMSFLSNLRESGSQSLRSLIEAMEHLSKVLKGHSSGSAELKLSVPPGQDKRGIEKLHAAPGPYRMLSVWLAFKSSLNKMASVCETFDALERWMLSHDDTYFSLIDQRLRDVTERLLNLDRSALPSHIHVKHYDAFVTRFHFGFVCRTYGCRQSFALGQDRDRHELSHTTSFVCLRCDFSPKGFKSKQALKIHTEKYHMSPDDFLVPQSLEVCQIGLATSGQSSQGSLSRSWTEQGQRAIQQSFQQVLTAVESKLSLAARERKKQHPGDTDSLTTTTSQSSTADENTDAAVPSFESIREAIKEQRYNSLCHFKDDLQNFLLGVGSAETLEIHHKVDMICDDEVGKVADGFPEFATVDRGLHWYAADFQQLEDAVIPHGIRSSHIPQVAEPASLSNRNVYWSLPEKKELPALLHRYGRDLVQIAGCLKTKTLEEIESHLSPYEEAPGIGLTAQNTTSEELTSPKFNLDHAMESETSPASLYAPQNMLFQDHYPLGADAVAWPPGDAAYHSVRNESTDTDLSHHLHHPSEGKTEHPQAPGPPRRAIRRPRGRRSCNICGRHFDEYDVKRHVQRYHTPTRMMWVCKDRSMTRKFFFPCKVCKSARSYASKHNAMKHLREYHFVKSTSDQTLSRWLELTEEPNPSYEDSDASREDRRYRRRAQTRPPKRRRLEPIASIRNLPDLSDDPNRLPAIRLTPSVDHENISDSSSSGHDTDSSDEDAEHSRQIGLLPGISFDNLLPPVSPDATGEQAGPLIRPEQVRRLPHLNEYQKTLCLDQVQALYSILSSDENVGYHPARGRADEELHLLSRTLLKGLREWRERSMNVPAFNFSILP